MAKLLQVQVCYAVPGHDELRTLEVEEGTTIEQAMALSGILAAIPGIDPAHTPVGLYGKKKPLDTVLRDLDRIEIYRPLLADPKETRRRRAGAKS